jgi:hypothetical protein
LARQIDSRVLGLLDVSVYTSPTRWIDQPVAQNTRNWVLWAWTLVMGRKKGNHTLKQSPFDVLYTIKKRNYIYICSYLHPVSGLDILKHVRRNMQYLILESKEKSLDRNLPLPIPPRET